MAEPQRPPIDDTGTGDATHPTEGPDPTPTDVETPHPPVGDTRDGDATGPTGEPDPAPAGEEPSPLPRAPLKFNVQHIPIHKVSVAGNRRAVQEDKVTAIASSIELIGLRTPIAVRILEDESESRTTEVADSAYVLVAGLHRLEACRKLGWRHIPAIVCEWSSRLEAERRILS